MKAAIFTFVALAVKLGSASADGNLQPKATSNTGALLNGLSRDPSGHGFNRLNTDGIVQSINAQGEILDEVQLTSDEAAKIRASVQALAILSGKETGSTTNLLERETADCPLKYCINTSDCPSSCPGGCMIVCVPNPSGITICDIGVCLGS